MFYNLGPDFDLLSILGPVLEVDNLLCSECDREFMDSFLYTKFDEPICDQCK